MSGQEVFTNWSGTTLSKVASDSESREPESAAATSADSSLLPTEAHQVGQHFPQGQVRAVIDTIEQYYTFAETEQVRQFLQSNRGALEILVDALPRIRDVFDFSELLVSLRRSREATTDIRTELYIRIFTSIPVDEAMDQLEQFDREWWLHRPPEVRDRICFDVDF